MQIRVTIEQHALFGNDGIYVITGGLGFVGRHLAQALFDNSAREIVLLSSSKSTLGDEL